MDMGGLLSRAGCYLGIVCRVVALVGTHPYLFLLDTCTS